MECLALTSQTIVAVMCIYFVVMQTLLRLFVSFEQDYLLCSAAFLLNSCQFCLVMMVFVLWSSEFQSFIIRFKRSDDCGSDDRSVSRRYRTSQYFVVPGSERNGTGQKKQEESRHVLVC